MSADDRVVVLGGTGFVGRHTCDAFRTQGYEVVAAARRPPDYPLPYRFITLDLERTAPEALAATLYAERPGVVVNTVGSIWGRTEDEMWSATAVPVLRLLDAVPLMRVRPLLIHLGSVLEYGPIGRGSTVDAATVARPTSAYGRSKLAATEAVLDRVSAGDVDGIVLRIANVAGPGSPGVSLLGRVAERLVAAAESGEPAVIELDPLLAHRDYIDVRDVADAIVAAARSRRTGAVVDIGRGEAIGVRDLVQLLIEVSDVDARVVEREPDGPRQESAWTQVDIRPAHELLGWRPLRSAADAVHAFWNDITRCKTASMHHGG